MGLGSRESGLSPKSTNSGMTLGRSLDTLHLWSPDSALSENLMRKHDENNGEAVSTMESKITKTSSLTCPASKFNKAFLILFNSVLAQEPKVKNFSDTSIIMCI